MTALNERSHESMLNCDIRSALNTRWWRRGSEWTKEIKDDYNLLIQKENRNHKHLIYMSIRILNKERICGIPLA